MLRALQVSIIRQGLPATDLQLAIIDRLTSIEQYSSFEINWLATELQVKFQAPNAKARLIGLLIGATTQEEQFQYAKTLSRMELAWELDDARHVVGWLERSRRFPGGKLVETTWQTLRSDFESQFSDTVKNALQAELSRLDAPVMVGDESAMAVRPIVRNWTIGELTEDVSQLEPSSRLEANGRAALAAAACLRCHRVGELGGQTGPDLTHVGKRYDGRAILESILEPSRQIDPKYLSTSYLLNDGRVVSGRTVSVTQNELVLEVNPISGETAKILRDEIERSLPSTVSPMPSGLVDTLTKEEILDLIALLKR